MDWSENYYDDSSVWYDANEWNDDDAWSCYGEDYYQDDSWSDAD